MISRTCRARASVGRGVAAAAAVVLGLAVRASAQVDGQWISLVNGEWTDTANWTGAASAPFHPDAGGIVTLNHLPGLDQRANININITDAAVTVGRVDRTGGYQYVITSAGTGILNLSATGSNIVHTDYDGDTVGVVTKSLAFNTVVGGGGTVGLVKTGVGTLNLAAPDNTYTGGTTVLGGFIEVSNNNGSLGDPNSTVTLDGGGLRVTNNPLTATGRNLVIGNSGGRLQIFPSLTATFGGTLSGGGTLMKEFNGTLVHTGNAAGFTGNVIVRGGFLQFATNSAPVNAGNYDVSAFLTFSNVGALNSNRIGDTAVMNLRGGSLRIAANPTTSFSEVVGSTNLVAGQNQISVGNSAGTANTLTTGTLTRSNRSTLLLRGVNMGSPAVAGTRFLVTGAAPTLVGGGGSAGSTNISILPWATWRGDNAINDGAQGTGLLTYEAVNGFRPLDNLTEYATYAAAGATDNVRATASVIGVAGKTINALVLDQSTTPGGATDLTGSGGTLTVTSGAIVFAGDTSAVGTTQNSSFISGFTAVAFGNAEGVIHVNNRHADTSTAPSTPTAGRLTISSAITGTGGLTKAGFGQLRLTGANTYTGQTTITAGHILAGGLIADDGTTAGALGLDTGAIVISPSGLTRTGLLASGSALTINRDIQVLPGGLFASLGTLSLTPHAVTVNGDISITSPAFDTQYLNLEGGGTAATAVRINGIVSGNGGLSNIGSGYVILSGNNTYSGETDVHGGTWEFTHDNAFGTGTISFSNAGTLRASGGTRIIANDILLGAFSDLAFNNADALTVTGAVRLTNNKSIGVDGATTTVTGNVSDGGLTKVGTGTLVLGRAAGNTYTGTTTVSAGTLLINNTSGSGTGTGLLVDVLAAGTFAGNGTAEGFTRVAGRLSPGPSDTAAGNGAGLLTLQNGLQFLTGSSFRWTLGTAGAASTTTGTGGVDWDQVNVTSGDINVNDGGAAVNLELTFLGAAAPSADAFWSAHQRWQNILNETGAGTTLSAANFAIDNSPWAGIGFFVVEAAIAGSGTDLVWVPIPEPSTVALSVVGLAAGLVTVLRRRRAARLPVV